MTAEHLKTRIPTPDQVLSDLYSVEWNRERAHCPFPDRHAHGDRDASLRYDQKKRRVFCASQACFGDRGADAIGVVQIMSGVDFKEATAKLASHYGVSNGNGNGARPKAEGQKGRLAAQARRKLERDGWRYHSEGQFGDDLRQVRFEHVSKMQASKGRPEKTFLWEHRIGDSWYSGAGGRELPVYRNVAARDGANTLLGVEGWAKADAAGRLGIPAVSFKELSERNAAQFAGMRLVLWPDQDPAGETMARAKGRILAKYASVSVIEPPAELPEAGDIIDAIGLGWTAARISLLMQAAPIFGAGEAASTREAFPLTQMGNAERLVKTYGADFRYCGPQAKFLVWDGMRFQHDQTGQMERWAKATVRSIYSEAALIEDAARRKATAEWAKRSETAAHIAGMLDLAQSEHGVPIMPAALDADPMLLNVANGTLDLRTGTLRPHRRGDLITRLAPVAYDPAAKCPRWLRFLAEVFEPHPDVPEFLQRFAGYSLTADTREECLLLLYGTGRNGKGTLLKILAALLGDYAGTADFSTFVAHRDNRGPRDDVANMLGRRFITAQEAREGAPLAESIIKWLTGGDRVRARKLHENSYEFDPTWKIWLASNYKPAIKGTDPAIWSRLRLVPFDVSFEGREDRTLKNALMEELPGVLAWAVEGCARWQAEGLPLPASVAAATGDYRAESDQVGRFIEDRCITGENLSILGRKLYSAYRSWAQEAGEEEFTETAFGRRLGEHFRKRRTDRGALYTGLALKVEA